jgi:4-amino-4-deoxy-L-arabinose transferase-like glycosyltransferase
MKYVGIIFVLILASVLRLYSIATLPTSMSDDEIRETEEAYSIAKTGKSLSGEFLPMTFTLDGFAYAPVPIYTSALVFAFLPLNEWSARLSYALAGIATVFLTYLVTKELFSRDKQNIWYATFAAFFLAIAPWHIHISRFAHEGIFPPMFYLLGMWLTFKSGKRNLWIPFFAGMSFFLGFYSYAATKIVYLPLIICTWIYCRKQLSKKATIVLALVTVFTIVSFVYVSVYHHGADYTGGRLFIEDIQEANLQVANERAGSHEPVWLVKILHNKLTYWGRKFLEQYTYAFSAQYLFTDGEAAGLYSLPNRGQLYLFTLPLIFLGLAMLFTKQRNIFWCIVMLLLASPLPSGLGINRPTYTHRSVMMLPYLSILCAAGTMYIVSVTNNAWIKRMIYAGLSVIMAYSVGSYLQQYYFEWPRYGGQYFSQTTKTMITKVIAAHANTVIIRSNASNVILHYLFYTRQSPAVIQGNSLYHAATIGSVYFDIPCKQTPDTEKQSYTKTLLVAESFCYPKTNPTTTVKDSGEQVIWRFYEYP